MRFGSLFSGCGGLDLGLESAGMSCAWQVEIDPQCRAVLARHWPEIPRFADIKEVRPEELAAVDLIAGGSPCQDLSVAGGRAGLDGERSGLFHEFVRVADSQPAAWILWENVDGALSSNAGGDFGIVLRELSGFWPSTPAGGWRNSGFCVGPKRWCAWRVLDSEYFGVPQRRYRVFVVGGPRDGACRPEVLLEPDCLPGHPPPSRETGAGVAGSLTSGASGGGGWRLGADEAAAGQVVCALSASGVVARSVAPALTGNYGKQPDNSDTNLGPMLVAHTLRGEGFDASEDGTGRGTPLVVARCLSTQGGQQHDFKSETLVPIPYHLAQITSGENRANPHAGDPAPALNGDPRLAIAFQCHGSNVGPMGTVRSDNGGATGGVPFVAQTLAFTCKQGGEDVVSEISPTLRAMNFRDSHMNGGGQVAIQRLGMGVRRLTPRECERLQAYPDDHTRYGVNLKGQRYELKDSPRYRMIGNGVTASVGCWIGLRIEAARV